MNDDLNLLREFARNNSEDAFAALVSRHVNLVYSVALRQVREPHLAQEITQAVFIILARKANLLGDKTILPGWLCRMARYASANALTIQRRRQQREQEAYMQSTLNEAEPMHEEIWNQIAPLLDGAMERLGQKDHDALVLRFFENKTFAEVGATLGASEDAREPRAGKAAEIFHETRREFDHGHNCRNDFRQFRSSRAGGAGKIYSCCGDCKRRGGWWFNLNPHQRSIENYGMDKSKNGNRSWRGHFAHGRNYGSHNSRSQKT
jgi:RNA polymerase sigma factor (sigma-70 family)